MAWNLCLVSVVAIGALSSTALASPEPLPETVRIFGGVPTETCEWPTTVGFGGCTGTLVHPQVVLTAGHCGTPRQVYFGEKYRGGVAKTLKPKFCLKNPSYTGKPGLGGDSHFCVLNEPVEDVPIAPIAFGCEVEEIKAGAKIWLVGFGKADGATAGSGVKHKVEVSINEVKSRVGELMVGGNGKATCYGDSGGPAFMKMSDGTWRTVGITSYGTSSQCGYPSGLTMASSAVQWVQKAIRDKGLEIDLQPCYDDDGKWDPTPECGGFATDPGTAYGEWSNMCSEGAPKSGPSSICGPKNGDAKGGSQPKSKPVKIEWAESVDSKPEIEEGESLEIKVKLGGNRKAADHLLLVVNGEDEHKTEVDKGWELEDLRSGRHTLVAQAMDEDGEVLAKTKALQVRVIEADEEDPKEDDEDESDGEDDDDDVQEDDDETADDDDDDDAQDDDDAKQDDQDPPKKGGCALVQGPAGPGLLCLALPMLALFRRRR